MCTSRASIEYYVWQRGVGNETLVLMDFAAEEIARQLTLIDWKVFTTLRPHELLTKYFLQSSHCCAV